MWHLFYKKIIYKYVCKMQENKFIPVYSSRHAFYKKSKAVAWCFKFLWEMNSIRHSWKWFNVLPGYQDSYSREGTCHRMIHILNFFRHCASCHNYYTTIRKTFTQTTEISNLDESLKSFSIQHAWNEIDGTRKLLST